MLLLGRSSVYPVGVLYNYLFLNGQLCTVLLLETGASHTSEELFSEDDNGET